VEGDVSPKGGVSLRMVVPNVRRGQEEEQKSAFLGSKLNGTFLGGVLLKTNQGVDKW